MSVQLVTLEASVDESLASDPRFVEAMQAEDWGLVAELVHQTVGRKLSAIPLSIDSLSWNGYYAVDADTRDVVGSCGFKGPPTESGVAEIAYFTFPDFEGQGYATSMADKLLQLVADCAEVTHVIAHTQPEKNASTRVLQKVGMKLTGEVDDCEDGRVWKWELINQR